jgi:hypothetical protein
MPTLDKIAEMLHVDFMNEMAEATMSSIELLESQLTAAQEDLATYKAIATSAAENECAAYNRVLEFQKCIRRAKELDIDPTVSDHAVHLYLQKVMGVNFADIKKEMIRIAKTVPRNSYGNAIKDGVTFVFQNNVITSIET